MIYFKIGMHCTVGSILNSVGELCQLWRKRKSFQRGFHTSLAPCAEQAALSWVCFEVLVRLLLSAPSGTHQLNQLGHFLCSLSLRHNSCWHSAAIWYPAPREKEHVGFRKMESDACDVFLIALCTFLLIPLYRLVIEIKAALLLVSLVLKLCIMNKS